MVTNTLTPGYNAIYIKDTQHLAIAPTSHVTSPFAFPVTLIRCFATVDCFIAIGPSPVASASSCPLPKGIECYFGVNDGDSISVISADLSSASVGSATGFVYLTSGDQ